MEAKNTIGGGTRTRELTLPGFLHDVCAAVHPLALASPFFRSLDLEKHGLSWIHPPVQVAHPLDDQSPVLLYRSLDKTADELGADAEAYRKLIGPSVEDWDKLMHDLLKPLGFPQYPRALLGFGPRAILSAVTLTRRWFTGIRARALFAGNSAHSIMPLDAASTAAFGLMLSILGHAVGWPLARGGSQAVADALASYLKSLGGTISVGTPVKSYRDLPSSRVVFRIGVQMPLAPPWPQLAWHIPLQMGFWLSTCFHSRQVTKEREERASSAKYNTGRPFVLLQLND